MSFRGFWCLDTGTVAVDGQDIRTNVRGWQRNLGVVPQMVFLIDDTLGRNIALGIPDAEIDMAHSPTPCTLLS